MGPRVGGRPGPGERAQQQPRARGGGGGGLRPGARHRAGPEHGPGPGWRHWAQAPQPDWGSASWMGCGWRVTPQPPAHPAHSPAFGGLLPTLFPGGPGEALGPGPHGHAGRPPGPAPTAAPRASAPSSAGWSCCLPPGGPLGGPGREGSPLPAPSGCRPTRGLSSPPLERWPRGLVSPDAVTWPPVMRQVAGNLAPARRGVDSGWALLRLLGTGLRGSCHSLSSWPPGPSSHRKRGD